MTSVTFFKTSWRAESSGHLDYVGHAVWSHLMVLLCFFYCLNPSHYSLRSFEITATPFSCKTPAVFCGLKNFT